MKLNLAKENNLTWHNSLVTKKEREKNHGHKGCVIWFTGLSASGKSTIAHNLEKELYKSGYSTYVFDGDNVRHGLCGDLGFSEKDRSENIRRIGEMANLFVDAGIIAITAFISPFKKDRQKVKEIVKEDNFFEIFVDCPVEICSKRDPKGIYKKALEGEIKNFTGISSPYETPDNPNLIIKSFKEDIDTTVVRLVQLLKFKKIIK